MSALFFRPKFQNEGLSDKPDSHPLTDVLAKMRFAWKLRAAKRYLRVNDIPRRIKWKGKA